MFFTYVYCNPLKPSAIHESGFEPFYVGKGKDERHLAHLYECNLTSNTNTHKSNTIRKIIRSGLTPLVLKVFESDIEDEALAEEVRLIALYGRADLSKGPLTNMTDGGEGLSGALKSEETRKKLSKASKAAWAKGKYKEAKWDISKMVKAAHTPEANKRRADSRRGTKNTDEAKANMSAAHKLRASLLTQEERDEKYGTMRGKSHPFSATNGLNPTAKAVEFLGIRYTSVTAAVEASGIHKKKLKKEPSFRYL